MSDIGANIQITGVVQGVGFRYFVYRNAVPLGLKGYVQNMPDGSVVVFAEGQRGLIEDFIGLLRAGTRSSSVTGLSVTWSVSESRFTEFEIR